MVLQRKPFVSATLSEERERDGSRILNVRLNKEELKQLEEDARLLGQEKASTALKQLAEVGHLVLHDPLQGAVIKTLFLNEKRNKRLGIEIPDPQFKQM